MEPELTPRPSLSEASMYQMRVGASEVANVRQFSRDEQSSKSLLLDD